MKAGWGAYLERDDRREWVWFGAGMRNLRQQFCKLLQFVEIIPELVRRVRERRERRKRGERTTLITRAGAKRGRKSWKGAREGRGGTFAFRHREKIHCLLPKRLNPLQISLQREQTTSQRSESRETYMERGSTGLQRGPEFRAYVWNCQKESKDFPISPTFLLSHRRGPLIEGKGEER